MTRDRRRREGGQALVVMVAAVIPALLMVGLIVDGGNAWSQQRVTQNAADAASDAGATILAERDIGAANCTTNACWDGKVVTAATEAGADKGVPIQFCSGTVPDLAASECTYYTDFAGTTPLGLVGTGTIPSTAAGVRAFGKLQFGTYFAKIAGIDTFTAAADAIAHFGYAGCSDGSGHNSLGCSALSFYINWVGCDKSGKSVVQQPSTEVAGYLNNFLVLPICKTTGNWGWLSDTDLATKTVPDWFDSDTGKRDNQINYLASIASDTNPPTILIPIYDCASKDNPPTCPDPSDIANATKLSDMFNCTGTNCWYHIVKVGAFELHAVYTGNSICSGQNSTECLYGKFVSFVDEGSLLQSTPGYFPGPTHGKGGARGVQLIK